MSTPAARPCRVIKISPLAARRRYFDKSSLTRARATTRVWRAFPLEPGLRFGFDDDGEDFDRRFRNVIKHPDVADSQAILRTAQTSEPLDSTLADLRGFEAEMAFKSVPNLAPIVCRKAPESLQGPWGQDDLSTHSG
jgi:hypothetical protein